MKMQYERATVAKWIDGDTCDVVIDLGFYIKATARLRLAGIDTPEKSQQGYKEACEFVNTEAPVSSPVSVICHGKDAYGRWLAEVFPASDTPFIGDSINKQLLDKGLAKFYKAK